MIYLSMNHIPLFTPNQIRAAEAPLIEREGEALMRRAAFAVAVETARLKFGRKVLVLAGSGNNGGDALYAAAELEKRGAQISVWQLGSSIHPAINAIKHPRMVSKVGNPDVIIDGIVGIGARGPLRGAAAEAAEQSKGFPVVAVDIPSGVDPMTGEAAGASISAQVTVTFGGLKPAHILGWERCGQVKLHDIGIEMGQPWGYSAGIPEWPEPGPQDHKYTHGVVGIYAGSVQYPGAAVLCVRAAARATSSMVRYAGPCPAEVIAAQPEAVTGPGRMDAAVIGPGFGQSPELERLLKEDIPLVIDADALTQLSQDAALQQFVKGRQALTVLTPHEGEFERLAGKKPTDRVADAQELARALNCVVLLKGRVTVITDGKQIYLVEAGTSWAATPGSGDVLAGVVGKAIAWRPGIEAVASASRLHALTTAVPGGPVTAGDIARALPQVRTRILKHGLAHHDN